MAEPLKNQFGEEIIDRIAAMVSPQAPRLDWESFRRRARKGYVELEMMDRARQIASELARVLPKRFPIAADLLVRSFGPAHESEQNSGMEGFLYLPFGLYIATHGLDDFDAGMRANYELTKRFTAEFSLRPFLEKQPKRALEYLACWVDDPNVHVRRLVSEGTRPRLPWAGRLRTFDDCPDAMIGLLTRLRDDPHEYVRRSVANHLNDIGKSHPDLLVDVCARWMAAASEPRRKLVRHALRFLVKQGHEGAIRVLGFDRRHADAVEIGRVSITPRRASIGESIEVRFQLCNKASSGCRLVVDLKVHYVKADSTHSPKVFKLGQVELAAGGAIELRHKLSLRQMTTRTHYPGRHLLEAMVNGRPIALGGFTVRPPAGE